MFPSTCQFPLLYQHTSFNFLIVVSRNLVYFIISHLKVAADTQVWKSISYHISALV